MNIDSKYMSPFDAHQVYLIRGRPSHLQGALLGLRVLTALGLHYQLLC